MLVYEQSELGTWLVYNDQAPGIVCEGETQEEAVEELNEYLQSILDAVAHAQGNMPDNWD